AIIESRRVVAKQELPGLVSEVALKPQMRSDLGNLQFSPDGKYLLAQDDSSIFVLTREPLASLFRIDALSAHNAHFGPDSRSVVFYDKELRVEKWDIASRRRTAIHQVTVPECFQSALSASGDVLGCIDNQLDLRLVDVNANQIIYEKKKFYQLTWLEFFPFILAASGGEPFKLFDLKFSPDDRYFAIGHRDATFVYDLQTKAEGHIPDRTKRLLAGTFAFISPAEIVGINFYGNDSKLIRASFPAGEKTDEFKFPADGWLSPTGSKDYLLVRPAGALPVGIVNLVEKKIVLAFKNPAFAIYGQTFAGEQNSGEVALFDSREKKLTGTIQLPDSPLAESKVSVFSPDGKWLAISGGSRASLWNLATGERTLFTTQLDGAFFDGVQFIAKLSKLEKAPSSVRKFDLADKLVTKLYDIPADAKDQHSRSFQMGDALIILRSEKGKADPFSGGSTMEVRDIRTNAPRWERPLQKGHVGFFYNSNVLTLLISSWDGIRAAAKEDAALQQKLGAMDDKRSAYLFQAFDATSGKLFGWALVDTGKLSFRAVSGYTSGETIFIGDSINRTLVYSLKTGHEKGKLIGHLVAASRSGDRALLENGDGNVDLYDTATLQPLTHFAFKYRVSAAGFADDGSLLVVTADQNVYRLVLSAQSAAAGK
ncbi:MAG TPA: WD40 repeat domain-containing protein, partial [Candidatus Angelobacter sp.]|nr:WD40 repeat domain-containing protein [Candidatus Angelobacter sp.]